MEISKKHFRYHARHSPKYFTVKGNFDDEARRGQKRFVPAINVLSNKEAFYGVNNGTNVSEMNIAA